MALAIDQFRMVAQMPDLMLAAQREPIGPDRDAHRVREGPHEQGDPLADGGEGEHTPRLVRRRHDRAPERTEQIGKIARVDVAPGLGGIGARSVGGGRRGGSLGHRGILASKDGSWRATCP